MMNTVIIYYKDVLMKNKPGTQYPQKRALYLMPGNMFQKRNLTQEHNQQQSHECDTKNKG